MTTATYVPTPMAFGATPQLAPYGFWGDLAGAVAPTAGRIIGGVLGNEQLGGQIGTTAGQLAQRFLPFQAGPMVDQTQLHPLVAQQLMQQQQAQLAPYGFFGDLAGAVAPTAGRIIGGVFGNEQLGGQIGTTAGQLAQRFLPFQAGPMVDQTQLHPLVAQQLIAQQQQAQQQQAQQQQAQQQLIAQQQAQQLAQQQAQLAPYGFWGDLAGAVAPTAGRIIGGVLGNEQVGGQIGATAGQLAQRFLPFQAGPMPVTPMTTAQNPQLAPYGLIGGFLGSALGGLGGGALGGLFGNEQLGRSIGSTAGGVLGGILPFGAGVPVTQYPGVPVTQYAGVPVTQYAGVPMAQPTMPTTAQYAGAMR